MAEKQILLSAEDGLVGADLSQAYHAVGAGANFPGLVARFRKKEEVGSMTKSILKHKIQTLTGRNIKNLEEEMKYKPKDPNEPSMDVETMRKLASSLILLSNGVLPPQAASNGSNGSVAGEVEEEAREEEEVLVVSKGRGGRKRAPDREEGGSLAKAGRRSLGAALLQEKPAEVTVRRGRKSLAVPPSLPVELETSSRGRREDTLQASQALGNKSARSRATSSLQDTSLTVTSCPSPRPAAREKLASVDEELAGVSNPTPMMKQMLDKRKSLATPLKTSKSPIKSLLPKTPPPSRTDKILAKSREKAAAVAAPPPSPGPRQDFPGRSQAKAFLVCGDPMTVRYPRLLKSLPLSAQFPGAHLTVVHTPQEWGPHEIYSITAQLKKLNKEAGLASFVLLVGTGLNNVHMNIEALGRHTAHTQFVTFHRADANLGQETGKLRETSSFFIASYFFPGCEAADSVLPSKMVRDGFSTCFVTSGTVELESSIVRCFSEPGEWLLDLACGARQLAVAALEQGRSAIAVHSEAGPLEDLGNYLRTLALESDPTYRDKDGLVLPLLE